MEERSNFSYICVKNMAAVRDLFLASDHVSSNLVESLDNQRVVLGCLHKDPSFCRGESAWRNTAETSTNNIL